jgi:hypothetical protein
MSTYIRYNHFNNITVSRPKTVRQKETKNTGHGLRQTNGNRQRTDKQRRDQNEKNCGHRACNDADDDGHADILGL